MSDNNNTMTTTAKPLAPSPAQPPQPRLVVVENGPMAYLMDTARFDHMYRIAKAMALSSLIPKHLVVANDPDATTANCFRVCNQAVRWGMDPFAVIDETYVVSGKLGYQGKLVAGVINTLAGLKRRLDATFTGTGDDLTITLTGEFINENKPREIVVRLGDVKTDKDIWRKQPRQKLWYTAATQWARRHCPEIMLGIMTDDDIDRISESEANRRVAQSGRAAQLTATLSAPPALPAPSPTPDPGQDTAMTPRTEIASDGEIDPDNVALDYLDQIATAETPSAIDKAVQQAKEEEQVLGDERLAKIETAATGAKRTLKR